jgi:hypothetical protein
MLWLVSVIEKASVPLATEPASAAASTDAWM